MKADSARHTLATKPFQSDDLERLFLFSQKQNERCGVKDLDASRRDRSRDLCLNPQKRDIFLIQFQQVIETVLKNAWSTGPENIGAREWDGGVRWGLTASYAKPCWRYNLQIKRDFLDRSPFGEGSQMAGWRRERVWDPTLSAI
jgi:hypothetical protein